MAEGTGPRRPDEANWRHDLQLYFTEWSDYHRQQPQPRGVPNTSVLCYRNSSVVILLHAPVVVNWFFLHYEHEDSPYSGESHCLPCYFRVFFEEYWLHRESHLAMWNHLYILSKMIDSFITDRDKDWDIDSQQDMVEYLTHVLNALDKQLPGSNEPSVFQYIFQLELGYQTTCEECGCIKTYKGEREFFLGAAIDEKAQNSIEWAIDRYLFHPDNSIEWVCDHCTRKNKTARRGVIRDAPEILLVQVNRFKPDKRGRQPRKLKTSVNFDEFLDITSHFKGYSGDAPDGRLRYQLFAAVYHSGKTISNGHYYTYARGPTGFWSCINDEKVSDMEFKNVKNAQSKDDCVYVLAYHRAPAEARRQEEVVGVELAQTEHGQLQTRGDVTQVGAQAAPDERSVDIRAEIKIDNRPLIGNLKGRLTLPGTEPLVVLERRKRVQPAEVELNMTMGNSRLAGIVKGNLKPMPGEPSDQPLHPPAAGSEFPLSQFAPPRPALPRGRDPGELDPQRPDPNPQGLQTEDLEPQTHLGRPSKRKRVRVEESQDPPAKRQRPGRKETASKDDKSRAEKKANHSKKGGNRSKSKGRKGHKKTNEGSEASAALDETRQPPKPFQRVTLKLRNSKTRGSFTEEQGKNLQEGQRGDQDQAGTQDGNQKNFRGRGESFEGDGKRAQPRPPVQPPAQPPAQTKTAQAPKPPPREGTRKNPPRKGKF